jgi:hypothetical protein
LNEFNEFLATKYTPGMNNLYLLIIIPFLLIFEEVQVNSPFIAINKSEQLSFLSRFTVPTFNCEAFYIDNAPSSDQPGLYYQVDAMMVSMKLNIPTVNGYSGILPADVFSMFPSGEEYQNKILEWLSENDLDKDVCELDYQTGLFTKINDATAYQK